MLNKIFKKPPPPKPTLHTFGYGSEQITYTVIYSKRKTLEISVHSDMKVIVRAPLKAKFSFVEDKIHHKARWILKKIHYFSQYHPKTPSRSYIQGESHLYLGKSYRLKISQGQKNTVTLKDEHLQISLKSEITPEGVKKILMSWYREQAKQQFELSLERCWPNFKDLGYSQPELSIRKMKRRWGSLLDKKKMTLNLELIRAPQVAIDYVVTHELCHLIQSNHGPKFYRLLASIIPNWKEVKQKLEMILS